jgi:hypothetical protein
MSRRRAMMCLSMFHGQAAGKASRGLLCLLARALWTCMMIQSPARRGTGAI